MFTDTTRLYFIGADSSPILLNSFKMSEANFWSSSVPLFNSVINPACSVTYIKKSSLAHCLESPTPRKEMTASAGSMFVRTWARVR